MSASAECIKQGCYYYEIQYFYLLIYFIFDSGNDIERKGELKEMGLFNTL